MTRQQAHERAAQLNRELPDGADEQWIVHQSGPGEWEPARISATGLRFSPERGPLRGQRGAERDAPVDPRPTITRLIPPIGPPGL